MVVVVVPLAGQAVVEKESKLVAIDADPIKTGGVNGIKEHS